MCLESSEEYLLWPCPSFHSFHHSSCVLLLQLSLHLIIPLSSTCLSFIISCYPLFPPSQLCPLCRTSPRCTGVRVRGELPGRTTEPVLEGEVMYLWPVLSFSFILRDNSFSQEMASRSPAATCYMCVSMNVLETCLYLTEWVGGCFLVSSSPLPAPWSTFCLSFLSSSSLPCLTFLSLSFLLHR